MHPAPGEPPPQAKTSTYRHRVNFYETDAMQVVHHSNYLCYFESARVHWLEEHDQPYEAYVAQGLNFAVTHADVQYQKSARFGDELEVTTWLRWVRGASLAMEYRVTSSGELLVWGVTEHAAVNVEGKVRRIPAERRRNLQGASALGSGDTAAAEG